MKRRPTIDDFKDTPAARLNPDLFKKKEIPAEAKKNKYGNVKVTVDGEDIDSKKEAKRLRELKIELKKGRIAFLARQVEFVLSVNGQRIASYYADFGYTKTENGELVVEDVKSEFTRNLPVYRLKRRMMWAQHKIKIVEV